MRLPDSQATEAGGHAASEAASLVVGIIGAGRAGSTLARSLVRAGHAVVVARRGAVEAELAEALDARLAGRAEVLATSEVTFLAVPDRAIAQLAEDLSHNAVPGNGRLVAHLSGSQGRAVLAPLAERGYTTAAIHPLQVLSGWRIAPGTVFSVEADPAAEAVAARLVADLSGVKVELPAPGRARYHAAAVMAANLGMTMLAEAIELLERQGIPRAEALQGLGSLVRGGLEASMDRGLPAALTGPVTRGDVETIRGHLAALAGDPELRRAYAATSLLTLRQGLRDGRPGAEAAAEIRRLLEGAL
ncbi:MAG TPA: Rossmann-like and DUF2520 domain-containing protein [Candidatus Dormibacteraeota bacterium]|nr:Rossmann-like and DUF2520 domain-containing protein [Candidatus Dormibacteraeota bacterium]